MYIVHHTQYNKHLMYTVHHIHCTPALYKRKSQHHSDILFSTIPLFTLLCAVYRQTLFFVLFLIHLHNVSKDQNNPEPDYTVREKFAKQSSFHFCHVQSIYILTNILKYRTIREFAIWYDI